MSKAFQIFQSWTDDERERALKLKNGVIPRRPWTSDEFKAANDNFDSTELVFYIEELSLILDLWVRCGGDIILTKLSYDDQRPA